MLTQPIDFVQVLKYLTHPTDRYSMEGIQYYFVLDANRLELNNDLSHLVMFLTYSHLAQDIANVLSYRSLVVKILIDLNQAKVLLNCANFQLYLEFLRFHYCPDLKVLISLDYTTNKGLL